MPDMDFHLYDYDEVVLDASFFINPFPQRFEEEFKRANFCSAKTFDAEYSVYKRYMTDPQRETAAANLHMLPKGKGRTLEYATDLWSNLVKLSEMSLRNDKKYLLITSNLLLVQQVILRQLRIDVFNHHHNALIPSSQFSKLKKDHYEYRWPSESPISMPYNLDEMIVLYTKQGRSLFLDRMDYPGSEAKIYQLRSDPNKYVKVFKKSVMQANGVEKIRNVHRLLKLNRQIAPEWAALPEEVLYWDSNATQEAGFVMKNVSQTLELDTVTSPEYWSINTYSKVVSWSMMLAGQIAYLGVFGIFVYDHNTLNFRLDMDAGHMVMLDTDSFCMDNYFCNRQVQDLEVSRTFLYDKDHLDSKADAVDKSLETLYARVFYLLTGNINPVLMGKFLHPEEDGKPRYCVPVNLWTVLKDVFEMRRLPSIDGLLFELNDVEKKLDDHPQWDLTYQQIEERYQDKQNWALNGISIQEEETPGSASAAAEKNEAAPEPPKRESLSNEELREIYSKRNPFRMPSLSRVSVPDATTPVQQQSDTVPVRARYTSYEPRPTKEEKLEKERGKKRILSFAKLLLALVLIGVVWYQPGEDPGWIIDFRLWIDSIVATVTAALGEFSQNVSDWFQRMITR